MTEFYFYKCKECDSRITDQAPADCDKCKKCAEKKDIYK